MLDMLSMVLRYDLAVAITAASGQSGHPTGAYRIVRDVAVRADTLSLNTLHRATRIVLKVHRSSLSVTSM